MTTDIVLELSTHCIETAARNQYRRLLDSILQSQERDSNLEEQLAILKEFLEQTDFSELRGVYPELAGGSAVHASVYREASGRVSWKIANPEDK